MIQKQKILAAITVLVLMTEIVFAQTWDIGTWSTQKSADDSNFLWIAKSRTAKILDDFNKRQQVLLFENVPISSQDEQMIFDSDSELKELEDNLKRVESRKDTLKDRKRNVTKQKYDLKQALVDLDTAIAQTEQDIINKQKDIANKNKEILEINLKIWDINEKISVNKKTILNYLKYIYSKWEWMYSEDNNIDVIKSMVINEWDIWEMLNDIHYKTLLELSGQNLVKQHRELAKEYYFNKEAVKKAKQEEIKLKDELGIKKDELNEQKVYKEQLLEETKWQEALYNKFIIQKLQKADEIKDQIDNIETSYSDVFNNIWNKYDCNVKVFKDGNFIDKLNTESWSTIESGITANSGSISNAVKSSSWSSVKPIINSTLSISSPLVKTNIWNTSSWSVLNVQITNSWSIRKPNIKMTNSWSIAIEPAKCAQIKKYFELEKKIREDESVDMTGDNPLLWPAEPLRGLSTYFHDEWYFAALWSEHWAIDIRYSQGTDLVAPAPWYVYFVSPPGPWKYSYIALKHANWFVTVYWHVSKIFVNQFDYVNAWEVFAKSWWAPWTPGAWPMTSWAHLHFEVYKDRQNVDPLRYMDVTHLNFDDLITKYRYKYIEDLKLKYWEKRVNMQRFEKFYIAWENEIDRQKYMLNKYASGDFNNWDIWAEEAINWQIDPSFLICVWLAETWLWKHLKTWFNVWNIWNTDSGWTYDFESAKDWISWMVSTLNNRYLWKYRTIDMLSRWWNKTGSIYASSSKNWHNNIVKCLSALKWRFIEDDYKFRLYESD